MLNNIEFLVQKNDKFQVKLVENCNGFTDGKLYRYSYTYKKDFLATVSNDVSNKIKIKQSGLLFLQKSKQKLVVLFREISVIFLSNSKKILIITLSCFIGSQLISLDKKPVLVINPPGIVVNVRNGEQYCSNYDDKPIWKNNDNIYLRNQLEVDFSNKYCRILQSFYNSNLQTSHSVVTIETFFQKKPQ